MLAWYLCPIPFEEAGSARPHRELFPPPRGPLYRLGVSSAKRIGNWTPDGKVERARLRRDYLELSGGERMKQVFELSRFMSRVAAAGRRARGG
jgi:hypothetical protein